MCRERELALDGAERLGEVVSALAERLLDEWLTVEIQDVESEDAHLDLDVLDLHILLLPRHKLLEGQNLLLINIPSHRFAVEHEALGVFLDPGVQLGQNIGILLGEVF